MPIRRRAIRGSDPLRYQEIRSAWLTKVEVSDGVLFARGLVSGRSA